MNPESYDRELLSLSGAERRQNILADALHAADRRRHMRAARRIGAFACIGGLLIGAFVILTRNGHQTGDTNTVAIERPRIPQSHPAGGETLPLNPPTPNPIVRDDGPSKQHLPPRHAALKPPAIPEPSKIIVQIIPADQVDRHWETINDDQLLATLADAGHPSGLVRLNGKAILVPAR